jgi:hypothetical protein
VILILSVIDFPKKMIRFLRSRVLPWLPREPQLSSCHCQESGSDFSYCIVSQEKTMDKKMVDFLSDLAGDSKKLAHFMMDPDEAMKEAGLDEKDTKILASGDVNKINFALMEDSEQPEMPPVVVVTAEALSRGLTDYSRQLRTAGTSGSPQTNPSITPQFVPQFAPTVTVQFAPTMNPMVTPQFGPMISPTVSPQMGPTISPTVTAQFAPTITVTPQFAPTITVQFMPTVSPPQFMPTISPTVTPQVTPQFGPMVSPTMTPQFGPTVSPQVVPTMSWPWWK